MITLNAQLATVREGGPPFGCSPVLRDTWLARWEGAALGVFYDTQGAGLDVHGPGTHPHDDGVLWEAFTAAADADEWWPVEVCWYLDGAD